MTAEENSLIGKEEAGHGSGSKGWSKGGVAAAPAENAVRDAVFVGTVHQSKGLEWPVVMVVRFNEV